MAQASDAIVSSGITRRDIDNLQLSLASSPPKVRIAQEGGWLLENWSANFGKLKTPTDERIDLRGAKNFGSTPLRGSPEISLVGLSKFTLSGNRIALTDPLLPVDEIGA